MGHGPGRWRGRPARARWAAVNGRRRDEGRAGPWRFSTLAPDRVNDGEALVLSLEAEEASRRGTCGRDEQEGRRGRRCSPAGQRRGRSNAAAWATRWRSGTARCRGISSRCQRLDAKQEDAGTDEADGRGHDDDLDSGEASWSRGGRDPAAARLREQRRPRADEWLSQRWD